MLNCPGCGVTNRPYDTDCILCKRPIQESAAAEAKRREWDALPPAIRAEQEKAFERMRESMVRHREWLKGHRVTHAVVGAVLVCLFMNGGFFFALAWPILIDLALGAAAGRLLNFLKGGSWSGFGVFAATGVVSLLFKLPFLNVENYLRGYWLYTCFALFVLAGAGYLMGLKLDFDHTDHSVTP